jgi:hypothetical protein
MTTAALARVGTSLLLMIALLAGPQLAYAAKGARAKIEKPAKIETMTKAAKAAALRAKLGGLRMGANLAVSFGTGILAAAHAAEGDWARTALWGGISVYNGIQGLRKWKAERDMNK